MIPVKLEITNFLSYQQTSEIDFSALHLVGIAGHNGAGKSSLLDALTWVLFGQSRSKDDDIINRLARARGESAEVRLIFRLGPTHYRVVRRHRVSKNKVKGNLELYAQLSDGQWRSLTEGSKAETQASLERILGLNYNTFVNVSFFLQGKADSFTTKNANERKEILAELLGVNRWDVWKEMVTANRKREEDQEKLYLYQWQEAERELNEEQERRTQLLVIQAQAESMAARLAQHEALVRELQRRSADLARQKVTVDRLGGQLQRLQTQLAQAHNSYREKSAERDRWQTITTQKAAIETDYAAYQAALSLWEMWRAKGEQLHQLQAQQQPHLIAISQERARLTQRQEALLQIAQQLPTWEQEKGAREQEIGEIQRDVEEWDGLIAQFPRYEQDWQRVQARLADLDKQRAVWQSELGQWRAEQARLEKARGAQAQRDQERAGFESRLVALSAEREALEGRQAERERVMALLATDESEITRVQADGKKLTEQEKRVQAIEANCPYCGQPLTEAHRAEVLAEIGRDRQLLRERYSELRQAIQQNKGVQEQLETALKRLPQVEKEREAIAAQIGQMQAQSAEVARSVADWLERRGDEQMVTLQAQLADETEWRDWQRQANELQQILQGKPMLYALRQEAEGARARADARVAELARALLLWEQAQEEEAREIGRLLREEQFAPTARAEWARWQREIEALAYDEAARDRAKQACDQLAGSESRYQTLQTALTSLVHLQNALAGLEEQIAQQQEVVSGLQGEYEVAQTELLAVQGEVGDVLSAEKQLFALREENQHAQRKLGAAKSKVDVLHDVRQKQLALSAERDATARKIQQLKLLEKACGRDGVQALLIEHALPEIEAFANDLLDQLSDGEMRLAFHTQKKLKTREGTAETLEIQLIDGQGERPYENFSGGEQFRINFAVRLALSRVLAQRAGTPLQTLVIDEGFGSQDPMGRSRLIEGIKAIQHEFALILVITHVEELRDQFPHRIEVMKGRDGSRVRVV